jgi:2-polyprenyl-3-methyl-5-hydroxy-6-metoxy-1,4-benzoquinol methylase
MTELKTEEKCEPYDRIWVSYNKYHFSGMNKLDKKEFENATNYFDTIYSNILPSDKNAKILDIGCGAGHFIYFLEKKGYKNYIGVDISSDQIEFVKKNISKKVELADAFNFLNGVKNEYDVIIGNDFIEHIKKERILLIMDLIFQALKPEGTVILKTPNMAAPFASISRYTDLTHEIGFTEKSLSQLLNVSGLKNVKIYPSAKNGIRQFLFVKFMKVIFFICGRVRRNSNIFTTNLIATGTKEFMEENADN